MIKALSPPGVLEWQGQEFNLVDNGFDSVVIYCMCEGL